MSDTMWRIPDSPGSYIVDRRRSLMDLAHREVARIVSVDECWMSEDLSIWIGEFDRPEAVPKAFSVGGRVYRRLLDHFSLPAVPDTALAVAPFDLCADAYDRLVAVTRDVANILNLLRVALAARQPETDPIRVLDFGCGTGLAVVALGSFDPCPPAPNHLTGTDRSPHMLQRAARRGLRVLTEAEWVDYPDRAFDALIASYVIHLGLSPDDCSRIARQLATGGVFTVNYHHRDEAGLVGAANLLTRAGLAPLSLREGDAGTPANPTILFGRPKT